MPSFDADGTARGEPFHPGVLRGGAFTGVFSETVDMVEGPDGIVYLVCDADRGGTEARDVGVVGIGGLLAEDEPPTDIALALAPAGLLEADPANTAVGTLSSTEPDENGTPTHTLLDDPTGRFKIVGTRLMVADPAALDHETRPVEDVRIRVTGSSGNTDDEVFQIAVGQSNAAPSGASFAAGLLQADITGDGKADFEVQITSITTLSRASFILSQADEADARLSTARRLPGQDFM